MKQLHAALALCLVWWTLAGSAHAQAPKTDAVRDTAKELFDKGVRAADSEKWDECRAALLAAWNIRPTHQIAGNLAECEAKLGRFTDATRHVVFFLRELPPNASQERKKGGEALLKEVRAKVAEVIIRVSRPDAEVLVDGVSVGRAPLSEGVFVDPGERTIEARLLGKTVSQKVQAETGGNYVVELKLADEVGPLPTASGAPLPTASSVPLLPSRSPIPAFLLGGAAVVVVGVGVGLNVAAQDGDVSARNLSDDIRAHSGTCIRSAPNYDARCDDLIARARANDTMSRASVGLFVGAGALAVGALIYWFRPMSAPVKIGAAIEPGKAASFQMSGSC